MSKFGTWLTDELKKRDMSQSDLARASNITTAQISRIISGSRGVGEQALTAIAHALRLPPEAVFRAAGILPQQTPENETVEQINHLAKELPADEQQGILEFVKLRHRIAEQRNKNETKRTGNKPAIP